MIVGSMPEAELRAFLGYTDGLRGWRWAAPAGTSRPARERGRAHGPAADPDRRSRALAACPWPAKPGNYWPPTTAAKWPWTAPRACAKDWSGPEIIVPLPRASRRRAL